MDRHSSYTAPRSDRSPASRGSRRSPKTSNNGRSGNENRFLHNLLWYVLPFIVFNLLLLFLVTASPRIELTVGDTTDYKTVDVSLKVKSLIPIRKLTTTLESQDIEFKKEGGVYHATLTNNGALEIYVEGSSVILKKYKPSCIFCDAVKDVTEFKGKNVCPKCLKELKNL